MRFNLINSIVAIWGFRSIHASIQTSVTGSSCVHPNCEHTHKTKTSTRTRAIKPESIDKNIVSVECTQANGCAPQDATVRTRTIVRATPVLSDYAPSGYETERTKTETTVYKRPSKLRRLWKPKENVLVEKTVSSQSLSDLSNEPAMVSQTTRSVTLVEEPSKHNRSPKLANNRSKNQHECCETVGDEIVCSYCKKQVTDVKSPKLVEEKIEYVDVAVPVKAKLGLMDKARIWKASRDVASGKERTGKYTIVKSEQPSSASSSVEAVPTDNEVSSEDEATTA